MHNCHQYYSLHPSSKKKDGLELRTAVPSMFWDSLWSTTESPESACRSPSISACHRSSPGCRGVDWLDDGNSIDISGAFLKKDGYPLNGWLFMENPNLKKDDGTPNGWLFMENPNLKKDDGTPNGWLFLENPNLKKDDGNRVPP